MAISTAHSTKTHNFRQYLLPLYLFIFLCTWIWTLINAYDLYVWLMENILLFIMVTGAILTYKKYPLSQLSYILLITFLLLHLYGARYTYENNPLGLWLQQLMDNGRNSYDRIVHFSFGLLWTYPIYDLYKRYLKLQDVLAYIGTFMVISTLASFYEIIEWIVGGVFFPEQGTAFIGLQGDHWDTQKDILLAILGSILALLCIVLLNKKATYPKI